MMYTVLRSRHASLLRETETEAEADRQRQTDRQTDRQK